MKLLKLIAELASMGRMFDNGDKPLPKVFVIKMGKDIGADVRFNLVDVSLRAEGIVLLVEDQVK